MHASLHEPSPADFDGDARPDLAVCNAGTGTVAGLLGRGDGSFQPGTTLTCDRPLALAVASLAGDSCPCLVVVGGGGVRVFRSRGDGTFERRDLAPLGVDLLPGASSGDPTPGEPHSLRLLTPRERQVAELVGRGYSTAEIAAELFISPRTVESHVANMLGRLDLRSRRQLFRMAAQALRYSGSVITMLWASDCMGVVERVPGLA